MAGASSFHSDRTGSHRTNQETAVIVQPLQPRRGLLAYARAVIVTVTVLVSFALPAISATATAAEDQDAEVGARGSRFTTESAASTPASEPVVAVIASDRDDGFGDQVPGDPPVEPTDGDEVPDLIVADQAATATTSIVVRRNVCFGLVDAIADDIDALAAACPTPLSAGLLHPGIQYTLLLSTGGVTTPALADANGVSDWDDVALGTYWLGTNLSPGFGVPVIHCRTDVGNSPWQRYAVDHGGTEIELSVPDAAFLCDWYDTPGPVPITVQAWTCPAAFQPYGLGLDEFQAACTTPDDGATFSLQVDGPAVERQTVDGTVSFEALAFLLASVQSAPPIGYADPLVFCGLDDGDAAYSGPIPAPGGAIVLDHGLAPGWGTICQWFNVVEPGAISVTKWLCPPGYDLAAPDADPVVDCAVPLDGVGFELSDGLETWPSAQTGDAGPGTILFGGLDPGGYHLAEDVPTGIVAHVVACTTSVPSEDPQLGPALGFVEPPVVDGAIDLELGEDETIVCDWYNVPAPDAGGSDDADGSGADGSDADQGGDRPGDGEEETGDAGNGSVVDVVTLPNTGAGPGAFGRADRGDPAERWAAVAAYLTLCAAGYLALRDRARPEPVVYRAPGTDGVPRSRRLECRRAD
jgi:hypothetical protein